LRRNIGATCNISKQFKNQKEEIMKKILLITLLALATVIVMAQQVERERVVMEIATGTWCGWCPGASVGADDMIANGHDVAVIKNQNGDPFANMYSNGRNSYYGISGYPTAKFDGVEEHAGGAQCPNPYGVYDSYLPKYNIRKAILSSFTIDMSGSQTGLAVNVTLVINKVASAATANCVVHLFITESHIQENWQGCMTELNHVNRLMVPGLDGTPLNLTNDEQTINLSFNLDGGWDQDHIELVAMIQNNTTKETYQATMSTLDELTPAPLIADFEASETMVCQGTNVIFTDNTQGSPSSWQWTFPGGTPSSSTQESPTVVYNTPGTYDVTLYVNDGFTNDEITKTAYITSSSEAPGTPGAPEGPDQLCKNPPNSDFTTSGSANAVLYDWEIDPVTAGFIMNDGNQSVTINFVNAFVGTASLKVKATNGCGESEFSDELIITVAESPTAYDVNGGGTVCEGASVEVEVTNSDTGIDYELFLDDEPTGYIITGTGDPITYSDITDSGVYTVFAFDPVSTCSAVMNNSVEAIIIPEPVAFNVTGGGAYCDGTSGVEIVLDGSELECDYELYLDDMPTSIIITGTGEPVIFENQTAEGSYTALGTTYLGSCTNFMEGTTAVTIIYMPETPEMPDGPDYIDLYYTSTSEYTTAGSANSTAYDWSIEPSGAGSVEIISLNTSEVTWDMSFLGTAMIKVKGVNECGESVWSEVLEVTVDNTVGFSEMGNDMGISISPNPTTGLVTLKARSNKVETVDLRVMNSFNAIIYQAENIKISKANSQLIDLGSAPAGIYFIYIKTSESTIIKKLIIQK